MRPPNKAHEMCSHQAEKRTSVATKSVYVELKSGQVEDPARSEAHHGTGDAHEMRQARREVVTFR
jgi:hypothetical protein